MTGSKVLTLSPCQFLECTKPDRDANIAGGNHAAGQPLGRDGGDMAAGGAAGLLQWERGGRAADDAVQGH